MTALTSSILSITQTITGLAPIFTPGADCITKWTYEASIYNALSSGLLIRNALDNMPDTTCYPPYFAAFRRAPSSVQVYSPASCPVSWTATVQFDNAATTTEVCCESGYSYTSFYSSANFGNFSRLHLGCLSTLTGTTYVPTRGLDTTGSMLYEVTGPLTMWAQPVTVARQQKDASLFLASSSTGTSTGLRSTGSGGGGSGSASTSAQTSTLNNQTSSAISQKDNTVGISSGTKIGIGIGVGLVALFLIAVGLFFIMRHRRKKLTIQDQSPTSSFPSKYSYYQHELPQTNTVYEKSGERIYEKYGSEPVYGAAPGTMTKPQHSYHQSRPMEME